MKRLHVTIAIVVALVGVGWFVTQDGGARLRNLWSQQHLPSVPATIKWGDGAVVGTPSAPAGVHKCNKGATITYTDAPCATTAGGGHEQALSGGTMTVVEGDKPKRVAPALPTAVGGLPNARALQGQPNEPTLRDKQIERAVNE